MTGGEQPIVSYELLSSGTLNILPYEFQALWVYEICFKYPFLFRSLEDQDLVSKCVEASLLHAHFLHFAGSWNESQVWKIGKFFGSQESLDWIKNFNKYLDQPLTGQAVGIVRP